MAKVAEVLKGMQGLGQQIISTQRLYYDGFPSTISKKTAPLHLIYYHVSTNPSGTNPFPLHPGLFLPRIDANASSICSV
jgi:hypothetical protein